MVVAAKPTLKPNGASGIRQWAMLFMVAALVLTGCNSMIASNSGTAPVGVPTGERSISQMLTDNAISRTADINLYKLDPRFRFARIRTHSFHSVVLLTGQVADPYLKKLAEDNLRAMPDVKAVHNYIEVGDKASYNTIVQDGLLTANIRKNLALIKGFVDSHVKIVSENGTVYVMGKLTRSEAESVMSMLKRTVGVSKIITLIDILPDDVPTLISNEAPSIGTESLTSTQSTITNSLNAPATMNSTGSPVVVTPLAVDPELPPSASETAPVADPVQAP